MKNFSYAPLASASSAVKHGSRDRKGAPSISLVFQPGQQVTHRKDWRRIWRCHIMLGSSSPKSSAVWFWRTWRDLSRMIIFLTCAIIVGKRNNKVCAPAKQIPCCAWRLNLDCYSEFLVTFFSLQRKECFTEHGILETLTCTKEHRGLAHRAVPNCLRSQLPFTAPKCRFARQLHSFMKKNPKQTAMHFKPWTLSLFSSYCL